jgi:hypothetical protein
MTKRLSSRKSAPVKPVAMTVIPGSMHTGDIIYILHSDGTVKRYYGSKGVVKCDTMVCGDMNFVERGGKVS